MGDSKELTSGPLLHCLTNKQVIVNTAGEVIAVVRAPGNRNDIGDAYAERIVDADARIVMLEAELIDANHRPQALIHEVRELENTEAELEAERDAALAEAKRLRIGLEDIKRNTNGLGGLFAEIYWAACNALAIPQDATDDAKDGDDIASPSYADPDGHDNRGAELDAKEHPRQGYIHDNEPAQCWGERPEDYPEREGLPPCPGLGDATAGPGGQDEEPTT